MFVGAGEKTYQGMIIGENARWDDLDVNPMKAKQLTNVRASGKDEAVRLTPPRRLTLEQAIAYIERRRAGRGDAQVDPPAQADPEPLVPQEARASGIEILPHRGRGTTKWWRGLAADTVSGVGPLRHVAKPLRATSPRVGGFNRRPGIPDRP